MIWNQVSDAFIINKRIPACAVASRRADFVYHDQRTYSGDYSDSLVRPFCSDNAVTFSFM